MTKTTLLTIALLLVYGCALGYQLVRGRPARWFDAVPAMIPVVVSASVAFRRTVRIYEKGIWVPAAPDKTPARFLTWSQIDRYQFEGDTLYLAGTESMLKGGPVRSASIVVPRDVQAQLMSMLAGNIGVTSR